MKENHHKIKLKHKKQDNKHFKPTKPATEIEIKPQEFKDFNLNETEADFAENQLLSKIQQKILQVNIKPKEFNFQCKSQLIPQKPREIQNFKFREFEEIQEIFKEETRDKQEIPQKQQSPKKHKSPAKHENHEKPKALEVKENIEDWIDDLL